jgi:hypothetical protein
MSIYEYILNTIDNKYNINANNYDVYKRRGELLTTYARGQGSFNSNANSISDTLNSDVILFRGLNCKFQDENNQNWPVCRGADYTTPPEPAAGSPPNIYIYSESWPNTLYYLGNINIFSYNNNIAAFHPVEYRSRALRGSGSDIDYGQYYMVGVNLHNIPDITSILNSPPNMIIIDYSERQQSFFDGKTIRNDPSLDGVDTVDTQTMDPTPDWTDSRYNICRELATQDAQSVLPPPSGCIYPLPPGTCTESCAEYVNNIDSSCSSFYSHFIDQYSPETEMISAMKTACQTTIPDPAVDGTPPVETNTRQPFLPFERDITANCGNVEFQGTTYYEGSRANNEKLVNSLIELDESLSPAGLTGKRIFFDPGCLDPNNIAEPRIDPAENIQTMSSDISSDLSTTDGLGDLVRYYYNQSGIPTDYVIRRSEPGQDWPAGVDVPPGFTAPGQYDYGVFCRKSAPPTTPCPGRWGRNIEDTRIAEEAASEEEAASADAEESRVVRVSLLQEKNRTCSVGGLNGVLQHCNWEPEGRSSLYRSLPSQCNESCSSPYKLWYEGCTPYFEEENLEDAYRTGRDSIIQAYGNDYLNKVGTFNNLCSSPISDDQLEIYSSGMPSPPIHCIDSTGNNVIDTEDLLATLRSGSGNSIHPCGYSYEDAVLYYNIHYNYISKSSPHTDTGDHCSNMIFNNAIPSPTKENGSIIQRLIKIIEENTGVNIEDHNDLESNVIPFEVSNLLNRRLFSSPPDVNLCQRYKYLYDSDCLKTSTGDHHPLLDRIHDHCNDLINRLDDVPDFNSQDFLNETMRNCRLPPNERYKSGGDLQESNYTFIGNDQFKESTSSPDALRNTNDIPCPVPYQGEYSVTCNYTLDPGVSTVEFTKQCSNQEYMDNLKMDLIRDWNTIVGDSATINNQASTIRQLQASASAERQREENLRSQRDAATARAESDEITIGQLQASASAERQREENLRSQRDAATARAESDEITIGQLQASASAERQREENLQNKLDKAEELQEKMDEENLQNKLDKAEELQEKMDEENWWLIGILIFVLVMVVGSAVVILIRRKNKNPSTPSSVGHAKAQPPRITDNPLRPTQILWGNPSASTST